MELVNEYPILSKIFTLEKNSTNEVYNALYKYVQKEYPDLFTPIGKMPEFVEEYSKELIEYYESYVGKPFTGKYKVVLRPVINNKTVGIPHKKDMMRIRVSKERIKPFLSAIYKKVNVVGDEVEVLSYKPSMFTVLIDPRLPLIDAVYIIAHELAHVYSLSQVNQLMLNLQMLHIMSASELLAVALSYKYLVDNDIYYQFGMGNNLIHYEYYVYSVDFLKNNRDMMDYVLGIIDEGVLVETESVERYNFSHIGKMVKFHNILYDLTVMYGSFVRKVPLEEVLVNDYMFVYYLFNPDEFKKRFENVYQLLSRAEGRVEAYHPLVGATQLNQLVEYVKDRVLSELLNYDPGDNTILERQSFEMYSYKNTSGEKRVLLK